MTGTYDALGMKILYPENWVITDEETEQWPKSVTVQSPSGAFWCVFLYPLGAEPVEVSSELLQALRGEYTGLEASAAQEDVGGFWAVGFDIEFYCLDLIVSAKIRSFDLGSQVCLLMYQAEEREFTQLETVFQAITASMLQSL